MEPRNCTLDEAREAKARALTVFKPLGRVVGVGITRVGVGYGLKVNLEKEPPAGADLPAEVDGVPVKVEVVGMPKKR